MKTRILLVSLILLTTIFMLNCAPDTTGGSSACGANVVDTGMALAVTPIGQNNYKFQLCNNPNPVGVFTVYGASSSDTASINAANWRLEHITDATSAGAVFQVPFHSTDTYFAIFMDHDNGDGTYSFDNQIVLVKPHALPKN